MKLDTHGCPVFAQPVPFRTIVLPPSLNWKSCGRRREDTLRTRTSRARPTARGPKGILQLIGDALLVQQRVAGRAAIAEKPDALRDKPALERLYSRMKDGYELKERLEMLQRKLRAISGTANAPTGIIETRRSPRLEGYSRADRDGSCDRMRSDCCSSSVKCGWSQHARRFPGV